MKNQSESRVGRLFRRIINIRAWSDFDRTKTLTRYLIDGFRNMFVPQKAQKSESFHHAVTRLKLSEKELAARERSLKWLSIFMLFFAGFLLLYAIWHLFEAHWLASLISLVVMCIALVLAFRYHFWYFQIKHRKLGCTFSEWYRQGLLGEKK